MTQVTSSQTTQTNTLPSIHPEEDVVNLFDLMLVLAKYNRFILKFTLGAAVIAVLLSFVMPKLTSWSPILYTATTDFTILPAVQQPIPSDQLIILFVGILRSNTIANGLIQQFQLQHLYGTTNMSATRAHLAEATAINIDKNGFINIQFTNQDPKLAATIANAYVENLNRLNLSLATSEAAQRRRFIEQQIKIISHDDSSTLFPIAPKEVNLTHINPGELSKKLSIAQMRAKITAQEIQLASMQICTSGRDYGHIEAEHTLSHLQEQLAKLELQSSMNHHNTETANHVVPKSTIIALQAMQRTEYQKTLSDLLIQQKKIAELDEARQAITIQIIDKAQVPETPTASSTPPYHLKITLITILAFFVAIALAFMRESVERAKGDPEKLARIQQMVRYLRG